MNDDIKLNSNDIAPKNNCSPKTRNGALAKLNEFNAKMSKSDFSNSYTRYSIELKLTDEALQELSGSDSAEIIDKLTSRKEVLLNELKKYGISYN